MIVHFFSVGQSVFKFPLPEIVRRGRRINISGSEFIVAEDGVIHHDREANSTWVTAPLTTEYVFNQSKGINDDSE